MFINATIMKFFLYCSFSSIDVHYFTINLRAIVIFWFSVRFPFFFACKSIPVFFFLFFFCVRRINTHSCRFFLNRRKSMEEEKDGRLFQWLDVRIYNESVLFTFINCITTAEKIKCIHLVHMLKLICSSSP